MLCDKCKKNQAIRTYEQTRNGRVERVRYCLQCDPAMWEGDACPYCGTTVAEFKKTKLVGCAKCYQTLARDIAPVVERMQCVIGTTGCHKGKVAYHNKQERIKQRCMELSTLAEQRYSENDDRGAGVYEERIDMLRAGLEEDFVWKRNRKYNP